ncbi:MAG: hypothetical protein ABI861_12810 [Panacibacter sp.]
MNKYPWIYVLCFALCCLSVSTVQVSDTRKDATSAKARNIPPLHKDKAITVYTDKNKTGGKEVV